MCILTYFTPLGPIISLQAFNDLNKMEAIFCPEDVPIFKKIAQCFLRIQQNTSISKLEGPWKNFEISGCSKYPKFLVNFVSPGFMGTCICAYQCTIFAC
jgi:hypothetical protein